MDRRKSYAPPTLEKLSMEVTQTKQYQTPNERTFYGIPVGAS